MRDRETKDLVLMLSGFGAFFVIVAAQYPGGIERLLTLAASAWVLGVCGYARSTVLGTAKARSAV